MALVLLLGPIALPLCGAEVGNTAGRAQIDINVSGLSVGNTTMPLEMWEQPDSTVQGYAVRGVPYEVQIIISQDGTSVAPVDVNVSIEIIHPVGEVTQEFWVNFSSVRDGQTRQGSVNWIPEAAHSILSATGKLSGGWLLRATATADGENVGELADNVREVTTPVAIGHDVMEDWSGGQISLGDTIHYGTGRDTSGQTIDAGEWVADTSQAKSGSSSFRHSPSSTANYGSNANDYLTFGWFSSSCSSEMHPIWGQGSYVLNAGNAELCKLWLDSGHFVELHLASWVKGTMMPGDETGFYAESNGLQAHLNFTDSSMGITDSDWTRVVWDLSNVLTNRQYELGFHFRSDSIGSTPGMVVDDWAVFGIEKVDAYTVDLQCDGPSSGWDARPGDLFKVECTVRNDGYEVKDLFLSSQVGGSSLNPIASVWNGMIRIDTNRTMNTASTIYLEDIQPGEVVAFNSTLTVPAGAPVQSLSWGIWVNDSIDHYLTKGLSLYPLYIQAFYGARITYADAKVDADATVLPGTKFTRSYILKNIGNADGTFNVIGQFSNATWLAKGGSITFERENGTPLGDVDLTIQQSILFVANVTMPTLALPGDHKFTLYATAKGAGVTADPASLSVSLQVLSAWIEAGQWSNVNPRASFNLFAGEPTTHTVLADGNPVSVQYEVSNTGNYHDRFDLTVLAYDHTVAVAESLPSVDVSVNPLRTPWLAPGESQRVTLTFVPHKTLDPRTYSIQLTATPLTVVAGLQRSASMDHFINVETTQIISVEAPDLSDESYYPGQQGEYRSFIIRNDGNIPDDIDLTLVSGSGVTVKIDSPSSGRLSLSPGQSDEVVLRIDVANDAEGTIDISLSAASASDVSVTSGAIATLRVGNEARLIVVTPPVDRPISGPEVWMDLVFTIASTHSNNLSLQFKSSIDDPRLEFETHPDHRDPGKHVLPAGDAMLHTLRVRIRTSTWNNLPSTEQIATVNLVVVSEVGSDSQQVKLYFSGSAPGAQSTGLSGEENEEPSQIASLIITVLKYIAMVAVLVALLVILVRILRGVEREDDDSPSWSEDEGYSGAVPTSYGVTAAPAIPAAPVVSAPAKSSEKGPPPLPASGLPDGWTTEQWQHYGWQWLESNP